MRTLKVWRGLILASLIIIGLCIVNTECNAQSKTYRPNRMMTVDKRVGYIATDCETATLIVADQKAKTITIVSDLLPWSKVYKVNYVEENWDSRFGYNYSWMSTTFQCHIYPSQQKITVVPTAGQYYYIYFYGEGGSIYE